MVEYGVKVIKTFTFNVVTLFFLLFYQKNPVRGSKPVRTNQMLNWILDILFREGEDILHRVLLGLHSVDLGEIQQEDFISLYSCFISYL